MTQPIFSRFRATALGATALCALALPAQADQVILDDLIVDGSACIGQDCVNGESFGFDTLRLKENNLRIKAQDTSASASFPSNDWQITFNDSSNGGQNKFSIDDIDGGRTPFTIEASAPSHSLYVDDGGRIGLGTSTPVVQMHQKDGNTPTLRLEQDGSSGFSAQTWDIAGNEANFFIRDASNGSTLPFRIEPGAPSNAVYIDSTGFVGFGVTSPAFDIEVQKSGNAIMLLESTSNGAAQLRLETSLSNNRRIVAANDSGSPVTQIALTDNDLRLFGTDFNDPWLKVDATGITTTGGGTCDPGPCDRTFDPEYFTVPPIEEHAAFMWENKYLWGVGPTPEGEPFNLSRKTTGMLHELEKAHIYIEQLHNRLKVIEEELEKSRL